MPPGCQAEIASRPYCAECSFGHSLGVHIGSKITKHEAARRALFTVFAVPPAGGRPPRV